MVYCTLVYNKIIMSQQGHKRLMPLIYFMYNVLCVQINSAVIIG